MKFASKPVEEGTGRGIRDALRTGIEQLSVGGVPSAALAAELLLMHVLDCDRTCLYAHSERNLSPEQEAAYSGLLARRAAGVPTQYLTGRQEFWGLELTVTPDVLIPRPETEHVIEVALSRLAGRRAQSLVVADVGTGSGCLAVALARELPQARIVATDVSAAALVVARRNAERLGVAGRIEFLHTNLLDSYLCSSANPPQLGFDLIVSNPPYVALDEAAELPREVREHEPEVALFAGAKGLDVYARLVPQASELVRSGGSLALELGHNSADYVRDFICARPEWTNLSITDDLAGIPRVLSADRV